MIGYLAGITQHRTDKHLIVNVQGVGYKVYATVDMLTSTSQGDDIELWIHTVVREDALDLYGFATERELEFFKLVIGVSGIGPKSALGILDVAPVDTLTSAIGAGDTSYLTKVSGIGKKIAQKIVLELKDKVGLVGDVEEVAAIRHEDIDVLEALKSLGYRESEARDALKELPKDVTGTQARITGALKLLGKD